MRPNGLAGSASLGFGTILRPVVTFACQAWASTNFDKRAYESIDAADKASCRPDFAVLIYPGGVLKRGTDELSPEIRVSSDTPPMFLAHAGDDPVNAAAKRRHVPEIAGEPSWVEIL